MSQNSSRSIGRHFLHIPGPPLPDRVLRAMDTPSSTTADRNSKKSSPRAFSKASRPSSRPPIRSSSIPRPAPVPGSRLGPDPLIPATVLMVETGQFAAPVEEDGREDRPQAGIHHDRLAHRRRPEGDRGAGLRADKAKTIKAVCVLHNETLDQPPFFRSMRFPQGDRRRRPSGTADGLILFSVARFGRLSTRRMGRRRLGLCAQKGLMMPPGMSFNAVSDKALAPGETPRTRNRSGHGRTCSP